MGTGTALPVSIVQLVISVFTKVAKTVAKTEHIISTTGNKTETEFGLSNRDQQGQFKLKRGLIYRSTGFVSKPGFRPSCNPAQPAVVEIPCGGVERG